MGVAAVASKRAKSMAPYLAGLMLIASSEPGQARAQAAQAGEPVPQQVQPPPAQMTTSQGAAADTGAAPTAPPAPSTAPTTAPLQAAAPPPPPPAPPQQAPRYRSRPPARRYQARDYEMAPPRRRRKIGLMIGGLATLGGSYLFTAAVGSSMLDGRSTEPGTVCTNCDEVGPKLFVPVAGPWLAMGDTDDDGKAVLALLGVAQLTGVVLSIVGTSVFASSGSGHANAGELHLAVAPLPSGGVAMAADMRF